MSRAWSDGAKSRVVELAILFGALFYFSSTASAHQLGELCGQSRFWARACAEGERCDIHFRLGFIRLGICVEEAQSCGGLQGARCDEGEFCEFPAEAMCGAADQTGVCRERPTVCTREYQPVCGCDDQTYGNRCEAAAAGVSVAAEGPCPGDDQCTVDTDCPHGACVEQPREGGGATRRCSVCGDGSEISCSEEPEPCPIEGQIREVQRGCYARCVDRTTCRPTHCESSGYLYPVGSVFYAPHSCNTCGCGEEGTVACGVRNCRCGYDVGLTWLPYSPTECATAEIVCEEKDWEWFTSYCGCGCVSRTQLLDP